MILTTNAVCMASSTPNPYGQPPVPPLSATTAAAAKVYYSDYNQLAGHQVPATINSSATAATATIEDVDHQLNQQPTRPNPHHQTSVDATPRANTHLSTSSLGNYDNYLSGMSSDSELTTASTSARHHHRPYSSQSRVYHAHPVPRNSQARLSHFSSGSAANVQAIPQHSLPYSIRPQQQLQLVNNNQASNSPSHQAMSSQKSGSGRQLPQRPFKQSLSIDQHSLDNLYKSPGSIAPHHHSPAHQQQQIPPSAMGVHRNIADQLGAVYQQKSYPTAAPSHHHFESTSSLFNESASQRNIRYEMSLMDKQAANMSIYDAGGEQRSMADLPPTGQLRSSSAASRHMPTTSLMDQLQHQQSHHHQIDHYRHNQDPYASPTQSSHHQGQKASSSSEWLPPIGGPSNQVMGHARGPGNQFKHAMSIDHYSAMRQQQQQRHFSPARQNQLASTEQYHSLGSYAGHSTSQQSMMGSGGGYESSALNPAQDGYMSSTDPDVGNQDQINLMKYHHYPNPVMPLNSLHHQTTSGLEQQQSKPTGAYEKSDSVGSSGLKSTNQQHHPSGNRPNLQHQPSSSSSNSNLSGSFNSNNLETNITNLDNRPSGSNSEHQKSISSASSHYQQSPQHSKIHSNLRHQTGTRQDLLRRGYTSMAAPSSVYGNDFGGSQSALSESGDLSLSQASHGGQGSNKRAGLRAVSPSMALEASSSAGPLYQHGHNQHQQHHQQHHSTSSGQGLRESAGIRSESSTGLPDGPGSSSALAKKSNSATQLSMTGTKKRLGFRKKQVTSFSVHRSEEVAPLEARHLVKQGSSVSEGDSSLSGDSSSRSWSNSNFKQHTSEEFGPMSFIDGLGKGQMISRQGLASPYLGDIQLSLCDRRGNLEVEIIRARNLQAKTNKIQPLTYVKLYLVKNRKCLAKAKTTLSNKRTLNPLFQQQLTFHEDYHGCILQSIVWGNFGKMDKKNFMGIAQISIDDLELSDTVISWYKLFLPSSLQTLPSKSLRHTLLSNSTESFTNTQNS